MAKRLADLFKVGTKVVVDDGTDQVEVWVQKLVPAETAQAIDRAAAKRSKFLTIKTLPEDNEEYATHKEDMHRLYPDRDSLKYLAAATELAQIAQSVVAEIEAEEEWSKDDYLAGLRAVYETEIAAKIDAGTDDPEALRVKSELDRFDAAVKEEYDKREARIFRDLDGRGERAIEEEAFASYIDGQADTVWVKEYRESQIWLATREPHDHHKLYFESREDINMLSIEVTRALMEAYQKLEVGPDEGKG